MSGPLKWCEPRSAIPCEIADELFEEQLIDDTDARGPILAPDLIRETKGELMKGEQMYVEERTFLFTTEERFESIE